MATLLRIVGAIWALIGAGNIVGMPWTELSDTFLGFGLIFNVLLFVLPGLALFGIGQSIARRPVTGARESQRPVDTPTPAPSSEHRLREIKSLLDRNLITPNEYEERRRKILDEI